MIFNECFVRESEADTFKRQNVTNILQMFHNRDLNMWKFCILGKLPNYQYLAAIMNTFAEVIKKITHMFIYKARPKLLKI